MKFIDLFAGLGGFHLALHRLGHECVYASEINEQLRTLYFKNFNLMPEGDIRKINISKIPSHDILCAGFPCAPFSKAGQQEGLQDAVLGDLYKEILKILEYHQPRYLILENVPNLLKHNEGNTWRYLKSLLEDNGYHIDKGILSPHHFGVPQIRNRVYIIGSISSLDYFKFPDPTHLKKTISIDDYLDTNPQNARKIPEKMNKCLDIWQEFLDNVPRVEKIPHPLWSMEFGATYPYKKNTPSKLFLRTLQNFKGSFGQELYEADNRDTLFKLLPSHARRKQDKFPDWKIKFITKNRTFYHRHKEWLDDWVQKIREFPSSYQKLEWNCQGEKNRNIRDYILQFRPSGVRVKRRTTVPSLVAMTSTQVPIIPWENRYITPNECLRLQSMDGINGLKYLPESDNKAYETLGNAINVEVVTRISRALLINGSDSKGLPNSLPVLTLNYHKSEVNMS